MDSKKDTIPDNKIETTKTSFTINLTGEEGNYLHLAAVDKVGNVSDVVHCEIDSKPPTFDVSISPETWTNKEVQIRVFNIQDKGGYGYSHTIFNGGQSSKEKNPVFSVNKGGTYQVVVVDRVGNQTAMLVAVSNIDLKEPHVSIQKLNSNKIRFEYGDK